MKNSNERGAREWKVRESALIINDRTNVASPALLYGDEVLVREVRENPKPDDESLEAYLDRVLPRKDGSEGYEILKRSILEGAKFGEARALERVNAFIKFEMEGFPFSDYSRLLGEFRRTFKKEFNL